MVTAIKNQPAMAKKDKSSGKSDKSSGKPGNAADRIAKDHSNGSGSGGSGSGGSGSGGTGSGDTGSVSSGAGGAGAGGAGTGAGKAKGRAAGKKKAAAKAQAAQLLEKNADLRHTVAQIEKQFGEGSIMPLASDRHVPVQGISTGSLSLDMALGGHGLPKGRVIEIFGPESSGKTTLALHVVAEAQKTGGIAAFIDAEHALDPSWAKKLGVQLETLLVSQPSSGEEAMQIAEMLIKSNAVDIVVIDSVAALVPKKELEGEIGDSHVGLQARLMSQSLRKLTGALARSKTTAIFINQIREKIGVMFGSPETTPGGRALKFYSSCRLDTRRIGQLKDGDEVVGIRVRAKVVKNKVAPPFRVAEFDMMYQDGISYEGDLIDLAIAQKLIARSGSWLRYGEVHLGQGREKARTFLKENPDVAAELHAKILAAGGFEAFGGAVPPDGIDCAAVEDGSDADSA